MAKYAAKKLLFSLPVLLGVTLLAFIVLNIGAGDPALVALGSDATPEAIATFNHQMGLDRPLYVQYADFLGRLVRGNLGTSLRTKQSVFGEIAVRYPYTIELALVSLIISTALGLVAGIVTAIRRGTVWDTATMGISLIGLSAPAFWIGLMLMMLFSYYLRWLPASGRGGPLWTAAGWSHILLPAMALGLHSAATVARMTRSSLLEVLNQDYIRTARSKGLAQRIVIFRHAMANALLPVITIVGLRLGFLLGGSVVVEQVFAWPGIGARMMTAIADRDMPVVQGVILMIALSFVMINVAVDLLYGVVDPRIRYD